MGFTGCNLKLHESIQISALLLELKDWRLVKSQVNNSNLLQTRTPGTLKRLYQEISSRLRFLSTEELSLLVGGTLQEQKCLLWLAICRRYGFIREFAREVIRDKFLKAEYDLSIHDFERFFEEKSRLEPQLESLSYVTKKRARQMIFQISKEVDILSETNIIQGIILSQDFRETTNKVDKNSYLYFPTLNF